MCDFRSHDDLFGSFSFRSYRTDCLDFASYPTSQKIVCIEKKFARFKDENIYVLCMIFKENGNIDTIIERVTDEQWHQVVYWKASQLHEEDKTRSDFDNWIMAEKYILSEFKEVLQYPFLKKAETKK